MLLSFSFYFLIITHVDQVEYFFGAGPDFYNVASAISMVLMVLILVCMVIMNRFSDDDSGGVIV